MSSKIKNEKPQSNHGKEEVEGECVKTGAVGLLSIDLIKAAAATLAEEAENFLSGQQVNAERLNGAGEVVLRGWHQSLFPISAAPRRGNNAYRPQEAGLLEAGIDVVQGRRNRTAVFYNIRMPATFEATLSEVHAQRVFVRTTRAYAESGDAHVWTGELVVSEVVNAAWFVMAPVYEVDPTLAGTYGALYGYKTDSVRKAQETKADHRRLESAWKESKTEEFQRSQIEGVRREMASDLIDELSRRTVDPGSEAQGRATRRGGRGE